MKRFHVHVAVNDLHQSIAFYSAMFGAQPSVLKEDYAKWMLDDPCVNFAISHRGQAAGINHLGVQAEDEAELDAIHANLRKATSAVTPERNAHCCYAVSDKYWVTDPQGIAWEAFHTLGSIPLFGADPDREAKEASTSCGATGASASSCCPAPVEVKASEKACCS